MVVRVALYSHFPAFNPSAVKTLSPLNAFIILDLGHPYQNMHPRENAIMAEYLCYAPRLISWNTGDQPRSESRKPLPFILNSNAPPAKTRPYQYGLTCASSFSS